MTDQVSSKTYQAKTRLLTVGQWNSQHDWPPVGGLRNLIFNRKINGFDKVVKKVGRRVLIDEQAFFEWVEEQQNTGRK